MANPAKNLLGQRFGYLVVTARAGTTKNTATKCATWECLCDCGNTVIRRSQYLRAKTRPHPRSCGCQHGNKKHGMSNTKLFYKWSGMLDRCYNPSSKDYKNWGARGITVCKRWRNSFENFHSDMGASYLPGLSLGRINNNKGYTPKNCRWETARQQANNTRYNIHIKTPAGMMTIKEASRIYNVPYGTLYARIRRYNWTINRALNLSTT